jgi:hypothetical protein
MQIHCYLGRFRPHQELPSRPWLLDGRTITQYFAEASSNDIDLVVDESRIDRDLVDGNPNRSASAYDLNKALNILIGNGDEYYPKLEPDTIGVLFAPHSNDDPGVFGLMFNGAFSGDSSFKDFQRQGAVVFVETIRAKRPEAEVTAQILVDSIHEIGHVFNLWHIGRPPKQTVMTRSDPDRLFPPPYIFDATQKAFLKQCSTSDYVRPGRSRFEERGGMVVPPDDGSDMDQPENVRRLRLRIDMTQQEFWPFEPVELDLTIGLDSVGIGTVTIPNEIDPGYGRFDIWVTDPQGQRRYRPLNYFCGNARQILVTPGDPFHRDISIFGQAGGYTFSKPGRHVLVAHLRLGNEVLRSNEVEVMVLEPAPRDRFYREAEKVVTTHAVSRLLFYRQGAPTLAPLRQALSLARRHPDRRTSANLLYALGRNFLHEASHASTFNAAKKNQSQGLDFLIRALDTGVLEGHRSRTADRLARTVGADGYVAP